MNSLYRTDTQALDECLVLMFPRLQPDDFRTEGGNINMPKVRSLWRDLMGWQPMSTAPQGHGAEVIAWFQKVKLDDDDNLTDEVIGGAMAHISRDGNGNWTEPEWLDAHGSYYFEDWSFAPEPVLWHPLPAEPAAADLLRMVKA